MNVDSVSYRHLLKRELSARSAARAGYSLRAFARDLEIEPAQLSRVLRGKQNISVQSAQKVARRLFRQRREQDLFISLVSLSLAKKPKELEQALQEVRKRSAPVSLLELSWIDVISDWYHLALLDLITLPNSPKTSRELARYLGISPQEAELALERLENLKLLQKEKQGWSKTSQELHTPSGIPSAAVRRYHKQMLQKAIASVDEQGVDERLLYGRTMTFRKADLPQLDALTREYFERVAELSMNSAECDALYQVNFQAFDLKAKGMR